MTPLKDWSSSKAPSMWILARKPPFGAMSSRSLQNTNCRMHCTNGCYHNHQALITNSNHRYALSFTKLRSLGITAFQCWRNKMGASLKCQRFTQKIWRVGLKARSKGFVGMSRFFVWTRKVTVLCPNEREVKAKVSKFLEGTVHMPHHVTPCYVTAYNPVH